MSLLTPIKAYPSIPHVLMESNQSALTSSFDSAVGEPPFRRKEITLLVGYYSHHNS